jgi:hypothetical protein
MDVVRNKKGWVRMLEIALAVGLLFAFIIYFQSSQKALKTNQIDWSRNTLQFTGESILNSLWTYDSDGSLGPDLKNYTLHSQWTYAGNLISSQLPPTMDYALYQFDNSTFIFRAGTAPPSSHIELVSVTKLMAGGFGNFSMSNRMSALKLVLWYKQ